MPHTHLCKHVLLFQLVLDKQKQAAESRVSPCTLTPLYLPRQPCSLSITPKEVPSMARSAQELHFLLFPVFAGKAKPSALAVSMPMVPRLTGMRELGDEPCRVRQDGGER